MRTPVRVAFLTVVITQVLAVLFAWVVGLGPAGLTLATSVGARVNAGLLFWLLRKHGFYAPRPGWLPFVRQGGRRVGRAGCDFGVAVRRARVLAPGRLVGKRDGWPA